MVFLPIMLYLNKFVNAPAIPTFIACIFNERTLLLMVPLLVLSLMLLLEGLLLTHLLQEILFNSWKRMM